MGDRYALAEWSYHESKSDVVIRLSSTFGRNMMWPMGTKWKHSNMMDNHYVAASPRLERLCVQGPHPKPCCSILSVLSPPWMLCCNQGPHCECVCECEQRTLTPSKGYGPTRNQAIFTLSRGAGYELFGPCYIPIITFSIYFSRSRIAVPRSTAGAHI